MINFFTTYNSESYFMYIDAVTVACPTLRDLDTSNITLSTDMLIRYNRRYEKGHIQCCNTTRIKKESSDIHSLGFLLTPSVP
jgi:type 1 glutamine amidotransferase